MPDDNDLVSTTDNTVIASLANVRLHAKSRLLKNSCCPDKDLVVLVSRVGNEEKLSLWKLQGSKKWEIVMDYGELNGEPINGEVSALNWSPDGQTIALACTPPKISLISIHDGKQETIVDIPPKNASKWNEEDRINGVWWFKKQRKQDRSAMPDLFRREGTVPGSALSILRMLPLLNPLQDDTLPLNATDLFAFKGAQTKPSVKVSRLPDEIATWPDLERSFDLLLASIKPSPHGGDNKPGEEYDEKDLTNVDSLLAAADTTGRMVLLFEGSYHLGEVQLGPRCEVQSVAKINERSELYLYTKFKPSDEPSPNVHNFIPRTLHLPLLHTKTTRQVAQTSSAVKQLVWYTMRVIKEMRKAWFGGDGHDGAREMNTNYVRGLQDAQVRHNQEENAVFDLTVVLTTGKSSPALGDFHQTGDCTSERGLQKWESTVGEALQKLRDYSEKMVAPACQRLHLLLEEVRGWSLLPQLYGSYGFPTDEVDECLNLAARGIIISTWLAATARREYARFTEFMLFLRYETAKLSSPEATHVPKHDILEVNEYLMSGLVVSSIDKWFLGPVPQFAPDIIAPPHTEDLRTVIDHARAYAADSSKLTWPPITGKKDLSHLDRNLDALITDLAKRCQKIFRRAAEAVAQTAVQSDSWNVPAETIRATETIQAFSANPSSARLACTHVYYDEESGLCTDHFAVRLEEREHGSEDCRDILCIFRAQYSRREGNIRPGRLLVAILECTTATGSGFGDTVPGSEGGSVEAFHILDMDFFDDNTLVIVYRPDAKEGPDVIGMLDYGYDDIGYADLALTWYVKESWQEDIVAETIKQMRAGQMASTPAPIRKSRALKLSRSSRDGTSAGTPTVAVNGRVGRRVACVLDGAGLALEMLDMEAEEDEEDEGGEGEEA